MKKRFLTAFCCGLILSCSLTACGSKKQTKGDSVSSSKTTEKSSDSSQRQHLEDSKTADDTSSDKKSETELTEKDTANASSSNETKENNTSPADTSKSVSSEETPVTGAAAIYENGQKIGLDSSWEYADFSKINSGHAVICLAETNRKNIVIGINAGHGTSGGSSVKTLCHPDGSPKTTGGSTSQGATKATAVSGGMTFNDGTAESTVTLQMAQILKEKLLSEGYDVLMIRNSEDVQLDNIARTVICNNIADCHIALHWDGDGLDYDKGCFYISVPDALKSIEPVASHWQEHDALGSSLVEGLRSEGAEIYQDGSMAIDLTQTSYSTVPSVDIELGNAASDHSDSTLEELADGLVHGINNYWS